MTLSDIAALLKHRRAEIRELAIRGISRLTRETDAEKWLDSHGFGSGDVWENKDGATLVDLLAWASDQRFELIIIDEDGFDDGECVAYAFSDGSVVWLTDSWWDTATLLSDDTGADAWWYAPGPEYLLIQA